MSANTNWEKVFSVVIMLIGGKPIILPNNKTSEIFLRKIFIVVVLRVFMLVLYKMLVEKCWQWLLSNIFGIFYSSHKHKYIQILDKESRICRFLENLVFLLYIDYIYFYNPLSDYLNDIVIRQKNLTQFVVNHKFFGLFVRS